MEVVIASSHLVRREFFWAAIIPEQQILSKSLSFVVSWAHKGVI
jgi:hypothetical protein